MKNERRRDGEGRTENDQWSRSHASIVQRSQSPAKYSEHSKYCSNQNLRNHPSVCYNVIGQSSIERRPYRAPFLLRSLIRCPASARCWQMGVFSSGNFNRSFSTRAPKNEEEKDVRLPPPRTEVLGYTQSSCGLAPGSAVANSYWLKTFASADCGLRMASLGPATCDQTMSDNTRPKSHFSDVKS